LSASTTPAAADRGLAAAVRRTTRGQRAGAMLLVAPLFVLLLLSFCLPIAALLARAVYDPTIHDALPRTAAALDPSPDRGVPDDAVFAAFGEDLQAAKQNDTL
jgi:putative spermidine/putrescine transport system permease protein